MNTKPNLHDNKFLSNFQLLWKFKMKFIGTIVLFFIPVILADIFFWNNVSMRPTIVLNYSVAVFEIVGHSFIFAGLLWYLLFVVTALKLTHSIRVSNQQTVIECYCSAVKSYGPFLIIFGEFILKTVVLSLFLIIPGLIYARNNGLAGIAYLVDGKKNKEAFALSKKLTKSRSTYYLGFGLLTGTITICLIYSVVQFLNTLTIFVPDGNEVLLETLKYIKYAFLLFISILSVIGSYSLYDDLKGEVRKD